MKKIGEVFRTVAEFTKTNDALRYARSIGLGSWNRQKREEARTVVRQMGSDMVPFLLEVVEGQKRHRICHRIIPLIVTWVVLATINVIATRYKSDFSTILQLICIAVQGIALLSVQLNGNIPLGLQKEIAALLSETTDVRSIPILLATIDWLTGSARESAQAALTRVLPTVTLADSALMDEPTRLKLLSKLEATTKSWPYYSDVPVDYIVAIVQGLSNLEETRVHPYLVKLNASILLNRTSETLATAAQEALPKVEEAMGRNKDAGSLLRPSESGSAAVLLKPAGAQSESEKNLLYPSGRPQ